MNAQRVLEQSGRPAAEVLAELESFKKNDADWKSGKIWSLVYDGGDEHSQLLKEAYAAFFSENGLNPVAFASLREMDQQVVRSSLDLLHAGPDAVGTMSSGGTESCLLAVKTWRDYERSRMPWIRKPEMILAESAHVAWEKGAEYFGVKIKRVPVDANYRMDVRAVRKAISRNTVLIVASAPEYPHGMIDPIEELGALALEENIPLHVDCCVGGFLLPFAEELGYDIPLFDFRVPGVSSISADLHKYGYAAKGASVILYRKMEYLERQFFISESWPGGAFFSSGLLGTRPGGSIAAAWAALRFTGRDGYLSNAKTIMETTRRLIDGIGTIPELEVIGKPQVSIVAYRSRIPSVDIFAVGDRMESRGWHIDRLQKPEALHAMVMLAHRDKTDHYLSDLKASVAEVKADPSLAKSGSAPMYGMIAKVPLRRLVRREIVKLIRSMYEKNESPVQLKSGRKEEEGV